MGRARRIVTVGVAAVTAFATIAMSVTATVAVSVLWLTLRSAPTVTQPTLVTAETAGGVVTVALPPDHRRLTTTDALERIGPADRTGPPAVVDPAVFYVSAHGGDDTADGQTPDTPWRSLQASLDRLGPGQTLYLMDGRYTELSHPGWAHVTVRVDGTPEAWITVTAAPGHDPVIVADSANGLVVQGRYVEVSDLTVTGEGFGPENGYGWGIHVRDTHHVRVADNRVSNMPVGGITAVGSTNVEVYRNEVFDNSFWGTEQGSGISFWHSTDHGTEPFEDGYHAKIVGNVVYRNENRVFSRWAPGQQIISDGNGIIVDENRSTGYTGRTLIANNVLFDNGGRAVMINLADRIDIVHNTTYRNGRTTDLAGGPVEMGVALSDDVLLLNNLSWARNGYPALQLRDPGHVVMGGNVFVTTEPTDFETGLDLVVTDAPGLVAPSTDPRLADFRPRPSSTVIDRAIETPLRVGFDADGNPRPVGAADVGAYELTP